MNRRLDEFCPGLLKIAAEHIHHQVEYGNININQMNFPSLPTTMNQYRELLNDMELASRMDKAMAQT